MERSIKNENVHNFLTPLALPDAKTPLDTDKAKTTIIFLSRLIDVGETLTRTNKTVMLKKDLIELATSIYNLADVAINKKITGKINPIINHTTQDLNLWPQQTKKKSKLPVDVVIPNIFKENEKTSRIIKLDDDLLHHINVVKNSALFKNLPQRLQTLLNTKHNNDKSLSTPIIFLNSVYNTIDRNSKLLQRVAVNKLELKEALAADIHRFVNELNETIVELIGLYKELKNALVSKKSAAFVQPTLNSWKNEAYTISDYRKFFI